ncbi:hypothetical protein D3C78_952040 [compost metagenome]
MWLIEPLLRRKLDEIFRAHHVGTLGIVLLQAPLIARGEILVVGYTLRHPVVAGRGFQIPELVIVHDGNAEALARPYGLDDVTKQGDRLAGRAGAGEQHIRNVILGDALVLDVRIEGERRRRGEDRFGTADPDAFLIETCRTVQLGLPVRHSGVTQGVFRQGVAEIIGAVVGLGTVHAALPLLGRMDHEMLGFQRIAVGTAGHHHGAIGGGLTADQQGRTGERRRDQRQVDRECDDALLEGMHDISLWQN